MFLSSLLQAEITHVKHSQTESFCAVKRPDETFGEKLWRAWLHARQLGAPCLHESRGVRGTRVMPEYVCERTQPLTTPTPSTEPAHSSSDLSQCGFTTGWEQKRLIYQIYCCYFLILVALKGSCIRFKPVCWADQLGGRTVCVFYSYFREWQLSFKHQTSPYSSIVHQRLHFTGFSFPPHQRHTVCTEPNRTYNNPSAPLHMPPLWFMIPNCVWRACWPLLTVIRS